ncbi:MAG: formate dehydrogenase accessory sulfurtransferase FdhD [Ignavibacteriales bacterium]
MNLKDVTGVVLAGGKSSRMGSDKASLVIDGRPMIARVVDVLKEVFADVMIVGKNPERFQAPGVRTIGDSITGSGPLVGIYSALSACETPYCFVVACDMPCARPALVRWMVEECDGYDAFVPKIGPYLEPLFATYSKKCLIPIRDCLERGDYRVRGIFPEINMGYADETGIRAIDPDLESFTNIDTREDLRSLVEPNRRQDGAVCDCDYAAIDVRKFTDAGKDTEALQDARDTVVTEADLTLLYGDVRVEMPSCSPSNLEYLAVGRLVTRGFIGPDDRVTAVEMERLPRGNAIRVRTERVDGSASDSSASDQRRPGQGGPGHAVLFSPGAICDALDDLLRRSRLFQMTGAAHAAALWDGRGILVWHEDIGRHNAVDKVIGHSFLNGINLTDKMLVLTGRINSEIVAKVISAGIPIVASKAPPTDLGVAAASRAGVTVVGFVRDRRITVYSCLERVAGRPQVASQGRG